MASIELGGEGCKRHILLIEGPSIALQRNSTPAGRIGRKFEWELRGARNFGSLEIHVRISFRFSLRADGADNHRAIRKRQLADGSVGDGRNAAGGGGRVRARRWSRRLLRRGRAQT